MNQQLKRPYWRLACDLRTQLTGRRSPPRLPELSTGAWHYCEGLVRQLRRAQLRGFYLAADELQHDLTLGLESLESQVVALQQQVRKTEGPAPTVGELYRELLAVEQEFDQVEYDRQAQTLTVETGSIELEGMELGPFAIRLHVDNLRNDPRYEVVALEPRPSSCRAEVTHPHVLDDQLCEGEGRQAIQAALTAGRLVDFFQMVKGILETYNEDSPYVALSDWYSQPCTDCGSLASDDDAGCCAQCGEWVCCECEVSCSDCGDTCCNRCLERCPGCKDLYCNHCLGTCSACLEPCCHSCLTENERCPQCHEQETNEDENDDPTPAATPPAVHAYRLGEAGVPA